MQPDPWAQCECVGIGIIADAAESVEDLVNGRVGEFLGACIFEEMASPVSGVDGKIKNEDEKEERTKSSAGGLFPIEEKDWVR